ncbi:MAG: hypothetical protein AB7U38_12840 [Hyphomicrobiales bacterium]
MRLLLVLAFLLAGTAAASAQPPIVFAPLPDKALATSIKPVAAGRGFNPANAAAFSSRPRVVRVEVAPAPGIQALLRVPEKGSFEAEMADFRRDAASSIPIVLTRFAGEAGKVLETAFGPNTDGLKQAIWQTFFASAVVVEAKGDGETGRALFFSPIFDGVVEMRWRREDRLWAPDEVHISSGERFRGASSSGLPTWAARSATAVAEGLMASSTAVQAIAARDVMHSTDDALLIAGRVVSFQRGLDLLENDERLGRRADSLIRTVRTGKASDFANAGLSRSAARSVTLFAPSHRDSLLPVGAIKTADGFVVLLALEKVPGVVMLLGISRKQAAALTPVMVIA